MEFGLRVVLLIIGLTVIIGMLWDMWRSKKINNIKREVVNLAKEEESVEQVADNFTTIYVLARPGHKFMGHKLFTVLADCNLYYGQHKIYHRYTNSDGSGNILFSVASAFNPGFLQPELKADFTTKGLVFFMQTTAPKYAFENMLRAAKIIAARLDGEVQSGDSNYERKSARAN